MIRVADQARNTLTGIEHLTDLDLNAVREALEQEARAKGAGTGIRHAIADRLIDRR